MSVFRSEVNLGCLFLGTIHLFLEYQVSQWSPLSSLDWLAGESQGSRTRIQLSSTHHHIRDPGPNPPIQHIPWHQISRPRSYLSSTHYHFRHPCPESTNSTHTTTPGIHAWDPTIQHTPQHINAFPGSNSLPSVCKFFYLCYIHAFIFSDFEDRYNFVITNLKFNHVSGIFKTSSIRK